MPDVTSPRLSPPSLRVLLPALATLVLLLFLQSNYRLVLVIGDSMKPSLHQGNLLVVSKKAYHRHSPERGDIVVVWHHNELIVKRIVGLPGEEVEIVNGRLLVNRSPVVEPHRVAGTALNIGRGRLATGRFAILGDNRGLSERQTISAIVSRNEMLGKVIAHIPLGG